MHVLMLLQNGYLCSLKVTLPKSLPLPQWIYTLPSYFHVHLKRKVQILLFAFTIYIICVNLRVVWGRDWETTASDCMLRAEEEC